MFLKTQLIRFAFGSKQAATKRFLMHQPCWWMQQMPMRRFHLKFGFEKNSIKSIANSNVMRFWTQLTSNIDQEFEEYWARSDKDKFKGILMLVILYIKTLDVISLPPFLTFPR